MTVSFECQPAWHGSFRPTSPHVASKTASMPPAAAQAARACWRLFTGQTVGLYLRIRANSAISTVGIPLHPNLPRRERHALRAVGKTRIMTAPCGTLRVLPIRKLRLASKSLSMNDYDFDFMNFLICSSIGFLGSMAGRSSCASTFRTCIK